MCSKNVNEANSAQSRVSNSGSLVANFYSNRDENITQNLGFFPSKDRKSQHPLLQEMQKKSHTFWDNIDRSKCSPVTPEVLGIHSAVPEWWSGHEESRTPHFLLHKSPNFQAGQHSCIWSSKVPRKTSTGYQNAGKISRRLLINTWMLQGEEQLKLSVPAHRTKFQQLQLKFQAMLGEIPSEDDQSPRKKKPRE